VYFSPSSKTRERNASPETWQGRSDPGIPLTALDNDSLVDDFTGNAPSSPHCDRQPHTAGVGDGGRALHRGCASRWSLLWMRVGKLGQSQRLTVDGEREARQQGGRQSRCSSPLLYLCLPLCCCLCLPLVRPTPTSLSHPSLSLSVSACLHLR
jgi:hypothetical protein